MARQIQGSDVKRDVDVSAISRLIQDDSIYLAALSLNKTLKQAIIDGDLSGGGGGGGGGGTRVEWREGLDAAQVSLSSDNVQIGAFSAGLSQYLYATVKVPSGYSAGTQVFLRMPFYSADTSGTVLFTTQATLVRAGTDTIGSTTNQRTSTNSAVTLSAGTVNEPQSVNFDLSSNIGEINGVAIAANDIIKIRITRGSDTATGVANAILDANEVTFA